MGADPKETKVDLAKLVKSHSTSNSKPKPAQIVSLNEGANLLGYENFSKLDEKKKP